MKTLEIDIASYKDMKARTTAIANGGFRAEVAYRDVRLEMTLS